jgi:hypothetical protein
MRGGMKAVVVAFIVFCMLAVSTPMSSAVLNEINKTKLTTNGWYWKSSYPNYAPQGMPDFDQKQDQWKKIDPGPNGVIDTTVLGDDIYNADENCIAPGPDCHLNSTVAGDDVEMWAFCGPVAIANCFWWFDSKFADPAGTPGDGEDQFTLVEDYGAGDDHTATNVPHLVEKLARAMNTTEKGTTYIDDMQTAIDNWFNATGLVDQFIEHTYDKPTFEFVETEIERSQNVILLLGSYDYISGPKMVDQSQLIGPHNKLLQTLTWWDFQSFIPTVQRLDAIQILIVSNDPEPCDVQITVYNTLYGNPIGTSIVNPGVLAAPTWIQFHFTPFVPLIPGGTYYFDVRQLSPGYHYEWFYQISNPYPLGQGWMNNVPNDPFGNPFDWTFKTEYFNPPPQSVRREGHYVTCAGVNSEEFKIAFSDPTLDVANVSQNDHNDAQYVSHDIYNVSIGIPQPDIDCEWWLPNYPSGFNYTIVEEAVVVCPVPDSTPPTIEITKPKNMLYFANTEIFPISIPLIIGLIDVEVTASDNDSGIDRVEFYIDNQYKANDTTAPYRWAWSEFSFFVYILKVVAYDNAGNNANVELKVWKFF